MLELDLGTRGNVTNRYEEVVREELLAECGDLPDAMLGAGVGVGVASVQAEAIEEGETVENGVGWCWGLTSSCVLMELRIEVGEGR